MGSKYSVIKKVEQKAKTREAHPIWRGIGFVMMILIPVLGWFGALFLLSENARQGWVVVPTDLLVQWSDPYILIKVILALAVMFLLFAIFQLITFFIYRLFAPPRYGPLDVPPTAYRGRHHNR